jgi:hypothetical protein
MCEGASRAPAMALEARGPRNALEVHSETKDSDGAINHRVSCGGGKCLGVCTLLQDGLTEVA